RTSGCPGRRHPSSAMSASVRGPARRPARPRRTFRRSRPSERTQSRPGIGALPPDTGASPVSLWRRMSWVESLEIIIQLMLVLALDTTTSSGSCALARDGRVVCEQVNDAPNAHAERLPGDLMSLLDGANIRLADIDIFAVATGPGSFTGLRIGIATMQGLAFAEGKPLIGVSGFDVLVRVAGTHERVATWVDAWRGEVFAALYENGREAAAPVVSLPEVLLESLRGRSTLFIGDGARAHADMIHRMLGEAARI